MKTPILLNTHSFTASQILTMFKNEQPLSEIIQRNIFILLKGKLSRVTHRLPERWQQEAWFAPKYVGST